MEEKLLNPSKEITLKNVIDDINKTVNKKFEIVENNDDMGKWTCLPILLLEDEEHQKHILEFIEFVDDLFITKEEKISYIITLSSIIKNGKLDILKEEMGTLFILADYFNEKNIEAMDSELSVVNHPLIINAARTKTLENDTRVKILEYAYKTYVEKSITQDSLDAFAKEFAEMIQKLDYYEIIKLI